MFLPTAYAVVTLQVGPNAGVSVPTTVTWTREKADPTIFDLRFIIADTDVGQAATIGAPNGELRGTIPVTFSKEGQFVLKAVDFKISSPTSTDAAGSNQSPSSASSKPSVNVPAIVGGVLGSVVLLLLLAILYVVMGRRRSTAKSQRRLTFHRDLMVQHRPPIAPDIEHGRGIGTSPVLPPLGFQPPLTVPTPQVPTRPQFRASMVHTPVPDHPPTHRQNQLGSRIVQLEQQMMGIRRQNRGQAGMGQALEHMKKQVEWLRAERDSPWARCETDVPHPLLDYYME
ncbi:hypothetical protein H0H87_005826 [Tephrocybe sp. NHM501043]|nr:hypothetical protein H0H87_005826 [Tephrocybe sp. NHM501043]